MRITDSVELDKQGNKIPVITGPASHTEVRSQKGYRYRDGFWDKVINDPEVQQKIKNRDMLGMIEHPDEEREFMNTPYDKASHVIMRAWMKGKDPWLAAGLLNNERGNAVKALLDVGHKPGVSTRALGDYLQDSVSEFLDENRFMLLTWDIVRSPNFHDVRLAPVSDSFLKGSGGVDSLMRHPLFREAVQMYQLRDSVDESYNEANLQKDIQLVIGTLQKIQNFYKR